ncbi:hypothetical protein [Sinobacterium norvegicum]|nr:hypothetical protein [Sinobacterium norvegicum]
MATDIGSETSSARRLTLSLQGGIHGVLSGGIGSEQRTSPHTFKP